MRIAVDAMGGDLAPRAAVQGALLAALEEGVSILLVGDRGIVESEIEKLGGASGRVEVVHAPETVGMDEPATAVRRKRRSSLAMCAELVREGRADAMVTAGNSGAAMVAAKLLIGAVPGVDRPALAAVFPNRRGRTVVLDVGANVDSRAEHLRQFAVMGHFYAGEVIGTSRPRIGLLSIGEEHVKGNDVVRDAHAAIAATGLNFVGNVEGGEVFSGGVDVVVCDGFVGNVALKTSEGLARMLGEFIREEYRRHVFTRLMALLSLPVLLRFRKRLDHRRYNGASLVGLRGVVIKSHGSADAYAFEFALRRAYDAVRNGLLRRIEEALPRIQATEPGAPDAAGPG